MYRWCLFFLLATPLMLALLVSRAHAVPVPGLYVVVVQERDPQQAAQQAMRQELVRLTGAPDAPADPQLASLIDDARRYVQLQRATTSGSTQIVFDSAALRDAIMAAGRSVWDPDRPLLWIALPQSGADASDDLRARLSAAAAARGLPLIFAPAATPADTANATTLLSAARRAGASAALLAQPAPADPTHWQWTLVASNADGRWTGGADSAIDGAVDALVRAAQALERAPLAEFDCHIQGVSDLTSFASLLAAIGNTPGIVDVRVIEVDTDHLTLHLKARGSAADIQRALGSDRLRAAGTGADGALEYRYTAGL
jgi:Uncharacterized protein conserved in bacteria (DUF2066)